MKTIMYYKETVTSQRIQIAAGKKAGRHKKVQVYVYNKCRCI